MKTLYIMCGCPGSGKSFSAHKIIEELTNEYKTSKYISRDEIRKSILQEGDSYFKKEKEVFKSFCDTINFWLKNNGTDAVIADATHLNEKSRYKLLVNLSLENVKVVAVGVEAPLDICLERNSKRQGFALVPQEQLVDMYNNYTRPSINEKFINHTKIIFN